MKRDHEIERRLERIERLLERLLRLERFELHEIEEIESALNKARTYPRSVGITVSAL